MKALITLSFFFVCAVAFAGAPAPVGVWKLTRYVDMTETSTSPADIRRNLGRKLTITHEGIEFRREHCKFEDNEVLASDEAATAFFLANKSFYGELHILPPVTIINTSCNMIIVGSRGEVFVEWEGNVYAAKKIKAAK